MTRILLAIATLLLLAGCVGPGGNRSEYVVVIGDKVVLKTDKGKQIKRIGDMSITIFSGVLQINKNKAIRAAGTSCGTVNVESRTTPGCMS